MPDTRTGRPISPDALNWRGDLTDLTAEQLRQRADAMAWIIANNAAAGRRPNDRSSGGINDPVAAFRDARDAWFGRRDA